MKFKGTVIAILVTILAVNCFTSYKLIEQNKEREQIEIAILDTIVAYAKYDKEVAIGNDASFDLICAIENGLNISSEYNKQYQKPSNP